MVAQYLKTTLTGMTGSALDYAMLVVSGVAGVQRMTREHLAIALALQVCVGEGGSVGGVIWRTFPRIHAGRV